MPEGEAAFLLSHGPRKTVTVRLSIEANTKLRLAGAQIGLSKTAFATLLLEAWADSWPEERDDEA